MAVDAVQTGRLPSIAAACKSLRAAVVACAFACAALAGAPTVWAQEAARVEPIAADGYGRLIFTFPKPTKLKVRATPGVLVLSFPEPVKLDVGKVPVELPAYVGAARTDPDGRGARFALAAPYDINTMEAAEKVVIDLLPTNWKGLPPGLPQDIIDELAERARDSERQKADRDRAARIAAAKPVDVRLGRLPTFTRMVFEFGEPTDARIERDGTAVTVDFEHAAKINDQALTALLPEWVGDIESGFSDDGGLRFAMQVDPAATVRGFPEGDTYVVDVTNPAWVGESSPLSGEAVASAESGGLDVAGRASEAVATAPDASPLQGFETRSQPLSPDEIEPQQDEPTAAEAERTLAEQARAELAARGKDGVSPAERPDADAHGKAGVDARPEPRAPDAAKPSLFDAAARLTPTVRTAGSLVNLTFPFPHPTAGAVFARDRHIWMLFDTPVPIDTRILRNDLEELVSDISYSRSGGEQTIRLDLRDPALVSTSFDQNSWVVTLGDMVLSPPKPLAIERLTDEQGEGIIEIPFATANAVRAVTDPDRGIDLFVVTGFGPARAIFKPRTFVDFQIDPSIHGVVVQPHVDNLNVTLDNARIRIGRERGLVLSGEGAVSYEAASGAMGDQNRPGYVAIENSALIGDGGIGALIARTQQAIAALPEEERTAGRVRLARLYLATDMAAEGLGMLRYLQGEDPGVERDPSFRALLGVGKVLMGRSREALKDFDTFRLGESQDIALWRGLAQIQLGDWKAAEHEFLQGEPAVGGYSARRQLQFRLGAARAALEVGDMEMASRQVGAAEALIGNVEADPELLLLWGWLNERAGREEQALAAYERVATSGDRKLEAEATLRLVTLKNAAGSVEPGDAIDKLETLAIVWRGDTIELNTLRELARLHVKQGDFRRAFELMKAAAISNADSPITRALEAEMDGVFADLFIAGKASEMPAIDALALYYDFRELTPVDRRGDEMIRALADRLIEVDLLDQAAQLLEHQVDNRLHGAARAQIAAKLALVYLMNRKPERALEVLARTRQAVLPEDVMNQRVILEARALSETGRADLAVDLLSTVEGQDTARLKADALWRAEKWQEAGDELERLLGGQWSEQTQLSDFARYDVMRAAIAYSLAGDNLGLGRIRSKYAALMSGTPDSTAFDVVTGGLPEAAGNFRDVVRKIAGTDTLDAFLADFKARFDTKTQDGTPSS